jgi:hypothetical protein
MQGHNHVMTQRNTRLSILFIILIACLTTFIFNLIDNTSAVNAANIELTSSNTRSLKSTVKAKDSSTTATDITNSEDTPTDNQNGLMVIMHRPKWRFDGNLIVQFEKLKSAAANGDNEASYILARNLRYCYLSPIDGIALEKKLEQAYEFSDSELAVNNITQRYDYCSGIEQKYRNQFYRYLAAAANNGYVAAQEVMGRISPAFFMKSQGYDDVEREDFIKIRDSFIEQKIGLLEQAAQNGSINAIGRLAYINRFQKPGEMGYVKAFGFNQVILELTQSNKIYNKYSRYQQTLHSQLTSEEIDNAFAMSEEWLDIIKANGSLYLNGN